MQKERLQSCIAGPELGERSHMNGTAVSIVPHSRTATLISGLILASLGIQGFISIVLLPLHGWVKTTWPFVNYGMFTQTHREGDVIPKRVIIGVREDGSQVMITPDDLGWNSYQICAAAVLNQERPVVNGLLSQAASTRDTRWTALRLVEQGMAFRWTGPVAVPEKELGRLQLEPVPKK
jgi:hypothetical protein